MTAFTLMELDPSVLKNGAYELESKLRQYWLPAFRSTLLPESDGPAIAIILLGERLVTFRDSSGRVGLIDEFCPHRRVSLAYGRVENNSIACIYHGWRLNAAGEVLECPGERNPAQFARNIRHKSYPIREEAGMVWTYMGNPDFLPDFTLSRICSL